MHNMVIRFVLRYLYIRNLFAIFLNIFPYDSHFSNSIILNTKHEIRLIINLILVKVSFREQANF